MNGEPINLKPVNDNFVTNSDDQRVYDIIAKVVLPNSSTTPAEAAELNQPTASCARIGAK